MRSMFALSIALATVTGCASTLKIERGVVCHRGSEGRRHRLRREGRQGAPLHQGQQRHAARQLQGDRHPLAYSRPVHIPLAMAGGLRDERTSGTCGSRSDGAADRRGDGGLRVQARRWTPSWTACSSTEAAPFLYAARVRREVLDEPPVEQNDLLLFRLNKNGVLRGRLVARCGRAGGRRAGRRRGREQCEEGGRAFALRGATSTAAARAAVRSQRWRADGGAPMRFSKAS
jgi:hypothetical protein